MRILVAGLGGIGQRHIRNLRQLLGSTVDIVGHDIRSSVPVVTATLQLEEGTNVVDKYGARLIGDLEEALALKPDVVFVCNPSSRHIPAALAAARIGAHLFIEKPLSHTWDGVDELTRLVEEQGLISMVGFQMRYQPPLQHLRALLEQKALGRILSVRAEVGEYLPGWHKYEDYRQGYAARRELGGGVILSQIHELDFLYWLFGLPRSIYARGGHLSRLEIDVEDTADILMECSYMGQTVPMSVHMDYLQQPPTRVCEVIGDAGKAIVDFRAPGIQVFDGAGSLVEDRRFAGFDRNQLFLDELQHFLVCLKREAVPLIPVSEGAKSLKMALAARESLATGQVIEIRS